MENKPGSVKKPKIEHTLICVVVGEFISRGEGLKSLRGTPAQKNQGNVSRCGDALAGMKRLTNHDNVCMLA